MALLAADAAAVEERLPVLGRAREPRSAFPLLGGFDVDDLLNLASADAEMRGYRALAVARPVQVSYLLLQRWSQLRERWFHPRQRWSGMARGGAIRQAASLELVVCAGLVVLPDEEHQELVLLGP